jgi:hypothetical protein
MTAAGCLHRALSSQRAIAGGAVARRYRFSEDEERAVLADVVPVRNGRTEFVGSDERAARRAIEAEAREPSAFVRIVPTSAGAVRLSVAGSSAGADVFLVVVEDNLVSDVTRGENAGQRLAHTAVARDFVTAGRVDAAGRFDSAVPMALQEGRRHVIAFVQEHGTGRVLGVSAPASLPGPATEGRSSITGRESPH